jgi:hypothetical protein
MVKISNLIALCLILATMWLFRSYIADYMDTSTTEPFNTDYDSRVRRSFPQLVARALLPTGGLPDWPGFHSVNCFGTAEAVAELVKVLIVLLILCSS